MRMVTETSGLIYESGREVSQGPVQTRAVPVTKVPRRLRQLQPELLGRALFGVDTP
jgi:hypothetical protein